MPMEYNTEVGWCAVKFKILERYQIEILRFAIILTVIVPVVGVLVSCIISFLTLLSQRQIETTSTRREQGLLF